MNAALTFRFAFTSVVAAAAIGAAGLSVACSGDSTGSSGSSGGGTGASMSGSSGGTGSGTTGTAGGTGTGSGATGSTGSTGTGNTGSATGSTGSATTGSTGSATGSSATGSAGTTGSGVSFASTIVPIFQANCSMDGIGCHGDPGVTSLMPTRPYLGPPAPDTVPQATLATIYSGLMVSSGEDPTMPLVSPNSDTNSYLMHKMDGTISSLDCSKGDDQGSCGLPMPYTATMLPQSTRDTIRSWINAGALEN